VAVLSATDQWRRSARRCRSIPPPCEARWGAGPSSPPGASRSLTRASRGRLAGSIARRVQKLPYPRDNLQKFMKKLDHDQKPDLDSAPSGDGSDPSLAIRMAARRHAG
jgi:hypothetical protein